MNLAVKIARSVSHRTSQSAYGVLNVVSANYWSRRVKKITAMVRVKNEAQFLAPSILSIAGLVDEVIIVDNQSTDATPEIIAGLSRTLGPKLKTFSYDHAVTRVGSEFNELLRADPGSPRLLSNYYNWCLARCSLPFVMKWDGDMIALKEFSGALGRFKKSPCLQFDFGGHNLSSDCKSLLTWAAGIEPRIFPKAFFKFGGGSYGGEQLEGWVNPRNILHVEKPLYAHMKYCKADPGSNQTPEFRKSLEAGIQIAGPTPTEVSQDVEHWLFQAGIPVHASQGV
jgi:hypothetical protein